MQRNYKQNKQNNFTVCSLVTSATIHALHVPKPEQTGTYRGDRTRASISVEHPPNEPKKFEDKCMKGAILSRTLILLAHWFERTSGPSGTSLLSRTPHNNNMISKDISDTANPTKYRPNIGLQTIYKIITACLSHLTDNHVDTNKILAEQQKSCRKFSEGCKEQLITDSVVLQQTLITKGGLDSIYISLKYQKYTKFTHYLSLSRVDP